MADVLTSDYMRNQSWSRTSVEQTRKASGFGVFKGILLFSAFAALFTLVTFFVAIPAAAIKAVEIHGASSLDKNEILRWLRLPAGSNTITVNCGALAAGLETHPCVLSVNIERRFPDTLVVRVTEREALALVYANNNEGKLLPHYVDKDGVVFMAADPVGMQRMNLPVISGLDIRSLRYGLRLGEPFVSLLASLSALKAESPALVSSISELRVIAEQGKEVEMIVYPASYRVPVRMKPVLRAGMLKSMLLVLDVVENEGIGSKIRELDMRNETYVYRVKEAVSG